MPNSLSEVKDRYYSIYANANYTYKTRYVLSGSARIDDSNLFGASANYRATPLWSVGGMWKLGDESFMTLTFIDQLNIRMTYGVNGNVDKTTSPFLIARYDGFFYGNSQPFARIVNPSNPLLRWEKTKAFNIGMDLSLFKNRLNLNLDVYSKRSYDLLGRSEVNPTYGFENITINTARLSNNGVDLTLSGNIMRQKNFAWSSMFNFAYNTNWVTSSELKTDDYRYYVNSAIPITGKPIEAIFSYRGGMLDSVDRPTLLDDKGKRFLTEDEIDLNNVVYSGISLAPYFGSLSNTFTYKQFEVSAMLTYKVGYVFRRPTVQFFNYDNERILHKDIAARWRKAGDEKITIVPAIPDNKTNYNDYWYTRSDKMIENASYIRLREVSLAYQFPVKMIRKLHLKQLSLMVYGRNLAIWTKNKDGIDPDVVPDANFTQLPIPRSFAFGLRTSF